MAPNFAPSQHDLIHDMIVDEKLKTRQMADVAECSERSIKAIRLTFIISGPQKLLQLVAESLGLLRRPCLKLYVNISSRSLSYMYLEEMAVFL